MANNTPIETIRDGQLKATIWKNPSENGGFYNVDLIRSYQDAEGNWQDSRSFSGTELLRVSHLATRAYGRICIVAAPQHLFVGTFSIRSIVV